MITAMVAIEVRAEHREAYFTAMREHAWRTLHDEQGCVQFDVNVDVTNPNRLCIYERFVDLAALEAHNQGTSIQRYRTTIQRFRGECHPDRARNAAGAAGPDAVNVSGSRDRE